MRTRGESVHRRISAVALAAAAIASAVTAAAPSASAAAVTPAVPVVLSVQAIRNGSSFTDNHGHSYPVTSTVSNVLLSTDADGTRHYALQVVDAATIPGRTPARRAGLRPMSSTTGGCEEDASSIIKMCLTQYYSQSGNYVEVDKYTASWLRLDSQFAYAGASVLAGVNGACRSGCGTENDRQSWSYTPANGTTYTQTPRWHGVYTLVDNLALKFQCGNSTVHMTRGSGKYTFTHRNVGEGGCSL
jgi:hypothetical protein